MRTVIGLFESGAEARRALAELGELGLAAKDISVVTNKATQAVLETGSPFRLHAMSFRDVGTVVASGALADTRGQPPERIGLTDMLQRSGLSPAIAEHYASGVERGETLESVTVSDADADRVSAVMKRHSGGALRRDVARGERAEMGERGEPGERGQRERETARAAAGAMGGGAVAGAATVGQAVRSKLGLEPIAEKLAEKHAERRAEKHAEEQAFTEEERIIPVYREELQAGKREVERGTVCVTTRITERPYTEEIHLREEHVEVERRPANRLLRPEESEFKESRIEMKEMGEEVIGAKQTRLVEEIVVHKRVIDRTATVGDSLRSTEVDVRSFDPEEYRRHFDSQKIEGAQFEERLPAYRFGEELAGPGAPGRWEEAETDARARWEVQHPGTWDKFKDSIRYAWSRGGRR
jgi:stress response protein YsnF